MRYSHFTYTSGGNPYIAPNDKERNRIIRKYKKQGILVEQISKGYYLIHDKID